MRDTSQHPPSYRANVTVQDHEDEQFNVECNIRKLLDLPWEQCPWPAVRSRMLRLAIEGAEIYAYRPAHQREWVIWFPLDGDRERERDARMSPREWAILHGYAVPALPAEEAE
jgi:hypothetical protein